MAKLHTATIYEDKECTIELGRFEYKGDFEQPDLLIDESICISGDQWVCVVATHGTDKTTLTVPCPKAIFIMHNLDDKAFDYILKGCTVVKSSAHLRVKDGLNNSPQRVVASHQFSPDGIAA